jgi:GTPase SAR1 family protein
MTLVKTMWSLEEFWERRTLILGDVNSGKTSITLGLVVQMVEQKGEEMAVFDLAPERIGDIGGKMDVPPHPLVSYQTTTVIPPRLCHLPESAKGCSDRK